MDNEHTARLSNKRPFPFDQRQALTNITNLQDPTAFKMKAAEKAEEGSTTLEVVETSKKSKLNPTTTTFASYVEPSLQKQTSPAPFPTSPAPSNSIPNSKVPVASHAASNEYMRAVYDIDRGREMNPVHCVTYVTEIYSCLRDNELRKRPSPIDYMAQQQEVTPQMRAILIDWLVEVSEECSLNSEVLYLTKNFLDRFFASENVLRGELQLAGISALLIAAKFEEVELPPTIEALIVFSDNTYTREEVIAMERRILKKLKFDLAAATEKTFLRRFQRAAAAHVEDRSTLCNVVLLSNYLSELTMQEYEFVRYLPSIIATAAVCISLSAFTLPAWSPTLEYYTKLRWGDEQLQSCIREMIVVYTKAPRNPLAAVYTKYSSPQYANISTRPLLASCS